MNAIQVLENGINSAKMISMGYLADLTDEEMMHRPDPKCNHIKWQLGHLLQSDNMMVNGCVAGTISELPEGFSEKYTKETCSSDHAGDFHSKEELLGMYETQTKAILEALAGLSEDDLDRPAPDSMKDYAPTFGAAFGMIGDHWLMHAGQWAVIRRQKGRSPIF